MRHRRWNLIRVVLVILTMFSTLFAALILAIDRASQHDDAQPADAILVLGAGVLSNGAPSPALIARTEHGISLYEQGYAPLLAFTGGVGEYPLAESEAAIEIALARGMPADALLGEADSHTTVQNLNYIAPLLRSHNVRRIIFVTSPFHAWRARHIVEGAGFEAHSSPAPADPTEARPFARAYHISRESILSVLYFLFGI